MGMNTRFHCLPGVADWLPGWKENGPGSLQQCGCTQWKQLIPLFYGWGGGGLTDDNRALSLEMSAVKLRDCPTGQKRLL